MTLPERALTAADAASLRSAYETEYGRAVRPVHPECGDRGADLGGARRHPAGPPGGDRRGGPPAARRRSPSGGGACSTGAASPRSKVPL
ncbi:MAG: hypothetical protein WDN49_11680 [Acetobacteraceae bacterium]